VVEAVFSNTEEEAEAGMGVFLANASELRLSSFENVEARGAKVTLSV
jgi:hypothetical protein